MPGFTIIAGEPGERWTNNTGKVQFQFVCRFENSCGRCIQFAGQIGPWWPLPLHRRCNCRNLHVLPGMMAQPFIDFQAEVKALDPAQQARVMGRSNWTLVEAGVVKWADVVHPQRILNFREVVATQNLKVEELVKAGVKRSRAETAYAITHTTAITTAERSRVALVELLEAKGISIEEIRSRTARGLASRIGIAGGPSGPSYHSRPPTPPTPPPPPGPPVILPIGPGSKNTLTARIAAAAKNVAGAAAAIMARVFKYLNAHPPEPESGENRGSA